MTTESETSHIFTIPSLILSEKIEGAAQAVRDSGSVIISFEEISDTKMPPAYLAKIKIKSAFGPVSGYTKLDYIPGYKITKTQDPDKAVFKFSWERV